VHGLRGWRGGGVLEVGADLVLQAVLDDGGVRAVGLHHLDALDEHEALRELVGLAGGLLHDDAGGVGLRARGQFADGELACAGLHVAQHAEFVVLAEDVFLGEVAMEVEAVEAEGFGCDDFFFGELRHREEAVESPEAPGDGGVDADAAAVEAEEGVGAEAGPGRRCGSRRRWCVGRAR
jgi:hypothetical protein